MQPVQRSIVVIIVAAAAVVALVAVALWFASRGPVRIDHTDVQLAALGERIYAEQCAACHGARLEGQPNWQSRNARGRLPAPPHDAQGHTWHHDDDVLFEVTKYGLAKHAPPGYESDMPAFEGRLSDDDIVAVLAFIKSQWPPLIHDKRRAAGMN